MYPSNNYPILAILLIFSNSQGGQVVHKSGSKLGASLGGKVSAVVIFGDPDRGKAITNISASKVDTICASGDLICDGVPVIDSQHLVYNSYAPAAATFVQGKIGTISNSTS
jgi:cutinase